MIEDPKKLERYRLADKVGWDMLNVYMDHLEKCKTCREHCIGVEDDE